MQTREAVLDASFWINAERSGLTKYLLDYFRLHAPPLVAEEVTVLVGRVQNAPSAATLFLAWKERGYVQVVAPSAAFDRFDAGENQAIALAQEHGWVLLLDDAAPLHYSRGPLRLPVVDSPAFAVFLYDQSRLDYGGTIAALRRSRAGSRMVEEALIALEVLARRKGKR